MTPLPSLSYEERYGALRCCGIDEAGRGPWAGPVVAAAVVLDRKHIPSGLNDSKKLSRLQRESLYTAFLECAETGVGIATVDEIDRSNILAASLLAMQRAFSFLSPQPSVALIDGNRSPALPCRTECIIKGDGKSLSIAAASIVAKVTRDRMMQEAAEAFPGYGFEKHSGYGTVLHQEALRRYGVTPLHRTSFAPIRALLEAYEH